MEYNFKIGDIVELDPTQFKKVYNYMPEWNTSRYYKIMRFTNNVDNDGFPIVILNKRFYKVGRHRTITTKFITIAIKGQRKEKLKNLIKISNEII